DIIAAVTAGARRPKSPLATYPYADQDGTLLYRVLRYGKDHSPPFVYQHVSGDKTRRVLYRWADLIKYPDATIFFTEGEKDADNVAALGLCATTIAFGKITDECIEALRGRDVIILQDNDEPGAKRALEAATALHGVAKTIRIVLLPG